jgi:hypothetical protein
MASLAPAVSAAAMTTAGRRSPRLTEPLKALLRAPPGGRTGADPDLLVSRIDDFLPWLVILAPRLRRAPADWMPAVGVPHGALRAAG